MTFMGLKSKKKNFLLFFLVPVEFRLARKINDQMGIDYITYDFLIRGSYMRYLRYDKVTTEYMAFIELLTEITKFIREQGNWSNSIYQALEDLQKQFLHSYKERIPTTLVVEMVRLAYEAGNREILNYFSQHYYSYL